MNDKDITREHLSALADGELQGEEFARAVAYAGTAEGQSTWRMYHLIGDTLRSPSLAHVTHAADPALVGRLREQLAQEPRPDGVNPAAVATHAAPRDKLRRPMPRCSAGSLPPVLRRLRRWSPWAGMATWGSPVAQRPRRHGWR